MTSLLARAQLRYVGTIVRVSLWFSTRRLPRQGTHGGTVGDKHIHRVKRDRLLLGVWDATNIHLVLRQSYM
jgi:hypothetical protein